MLLNRLYTAVGQVYARKRSAKIERIWEIARERNEEHRKTPKMEGTTEIDLPSGRISLKREHAY